MNYMMISCPTGERLRMGTSVFGPGVSVSEQQEAGFKKPRRRALRILDSHTMSRIVAPP
jgi:hypothetical protein